MTAPNATGRSHASSQPQVVDYYSCSDDDSSIAERPMRKTAFKIPDTVKLMLAGAALMVVASVGMSLAGVVSLIPVVGPAFAVALVLSGFAISVLGSLGFVLGTIGASLQLMGYLMSKI